MPTPLLSRDEVVNRVMTVLRLQGYDGASIAELSKATGLGKSSLYHHFPDGKDDMVGAVLDHLEATLEMQVFAPLRGTGTPEARLRAMNRALDAFYNHGQDACLLANLGIGESSRPFHARVKRIFEQWVDALIKPLRAAGLSPSVARARAEEAIVRIEGAVVLARWLQDTAVFTRTLRALPEELLRR